MIENRRNPSKGENIVMTQCPFCETPIKEQQGFANHWGTCPNNPANTNADANEQGT